MPYIQRKDRLDIDARIDSLINQCMTIKNFGDNRGGILNYIITRLAIAFMGKISYKNLSLMKSAMSDAADEWYRRMMAPYEDEKIKQNGDIPGYGNK